MHLHEIVSVRSSLEATSVDSLEAKEGFERLIAEVELFGNMSRGPRSADMLSTPERKMTHVV